MKVIKEYLILPNTGRM